jgi:hypothetical protein
LYIFLATSTLDRGFPHRIISACNPEREFLPKNFYRIDLIVIPKLGLYANFVAQVVSQISSHFIIHYDRKVVREAKRRLERGQGEVPSSAPVEAVSSGQHCPKQSGAATLTTSQSLSATCQAEESLLRTPILVRIAAKPTNWHLDLL